MAKKSIIQRELKRKKMLLKYKNKRQILLDKFKSADTPENKWLARMELQKIPKNASVSRKSSRCFLTGRVHGVYSRFGLSRIKLREYAMKGEIPGIIMSSW